MDLPEFLLARFAEAEAAARAAGNLKMWLDDRGRGWIEHPDGGRIGLGNKMDIDLVVGRWLNHVALHMPGRVLAECKAKRRIVESRAGIAVPLKEVHDEVQHQREYVWRLLALPYADHPDYHEEWRP